VEQSDESAARACFQTPGTKRMQRACKEIKTSLFGKKKKDAFYSWGHMCVNVCLLLGVGALKVCDLVFVCRSGMCMCLQRYLVAVGGMALQQQRREQLDQALSAEDTALLQQKGVLEPAIPQPSGIRREAGAGVRVGGIRRKKKIGFSY